MNEREHGGMWVARGIAIQIMLANIYSSPLKWNEVAALYRALLGTQPAAREECQKCVGIGTLNDADGDDTYYNEWQCPDCKGTGFAPSEESNHG